MVWSGVVEEPESRKATGKTAGTRGKAQMERKEEQVVRPKGASRGAEQSKRGVCGATGEARCLMGKHRLGSVGVTSIATAGTG